MKSKKSHENYILIDHRASPGLSEEALNNGIPASLIVPAGKFLELASVTCKHCQAEIILNKARTRARGYCPNCDHYICDKCDAIRLIQGCKTIDKQFDDILALVEKQSNIHEL